VCVVESPDKWHFPPDEPSIPLELLSAETLETGVLNLSYARAND
jgi:hypothetical protein